ncbi:MAG: hypothetical protein R2857_01540 [Vampirovibrionales bacterium]
MGFVTAPSMAVAEINWPSAWWKEAGGSKQPGARHLESIYVWRGKLAQEPESC